MNNGNVDTDAIFANLRGEFLTDCVDYLERANKAIEGMAAEDGGTEEYLEKIQRHVHSIKGMGGSFGFPSISRVAHALEDFMEAHPNILTDWRGIESYLDEIRRIANSGEDVTGLDLSRTLDDLPKAHRRAHSQTGAPAGTEMQPDLKELRPRIAAVRPAREVNVLLVMPKCVQRKIVGQEMASCGFGISFVDTGVAAIGLALAKKPDIIASNMMLDDMTGGDLARAVAGIEAIRNTRFVLMVSHQANYPEAVDLPDGAAVVTKDGEYAEALTEHLMKWGFFGEAGMELATRNLS